MSDKTNHSDKNSLISKFSIAGISEESLNNAADAHALLQSREATGSIVLKP